MASTTPANAARRRRLLEKAKLVMPPEADQEMARIERGVIDEVWTGKRPRPQPSKRMLQR